MTHTSEEPLTVFPFWSHSIDACCSLTKHRNMKKWKFPAQLGCREFKLLLKATFSGCPHWLVSESCFGTPLCLSGGTPGNLGAYVTMLGGWSPHSRFTDGKLELREGRLVGGERASGSVCSLRQPLLWTAPAQARRKAPPFFRFVSCLLCR